MRLEGRFNCGIEARFVSRVEAEAGGVLTTAEIDDDFSSLGNASGDSVSDFLKSEMPFSKQLFSFLLLSLKLLSM